MEQFKEKFHNCDVLLMEDIHTLSGRIKTQEELTAAVISQILNRIYFHAYQGG